MSGVYFIVGMNFSTVHLQTGLGAHLGSYRVGTPGGGGFLGLETGILLKLSFTSI